MLVVSAAQGNGCDGKVGVVHRVSRVRNSVVNHRSNMVECVFQGLGSCFGIWLLVFFDVIIKSIKIQYTQESTEMLNLHYKFNRYPFVRRCQNSSSINPWHVHFSRPCPDAP